MNGQLLRKYYNGECTPGEELEVLNWFKSKSLNPDQEHNLYQIWQDSRMESKETDISPDSIRVFDQIIHSIDAKEVDLAEGESVKGENVFLKKSGRWKWLASAVAAAAMILIVTKFFLVNNPDQIESPKVITVVSPYQQRKVVKLRDGSVIHLNSGSSIVYTQPFTGDNREITLAGEAFFDVAHDSLHPFIVKTGHIATRALGTSFNIKYRLNTKDISVALATGSVRIDQIQGKNSGIAKLIPGQELTYNVLNEDFQVKNYDSLDVFGWQKGILNFKRADLREVIEKLENWYGVVIELKGNIPGNKNQWKYSGSYENQSLDNVLTGISFVKKFSYEIEGNKVIMNFK